MDDLAKLDATAQAELVRRREVSPLELVEAAIARIERLNPTLNAFVTLTAEQAMKDARAAERALGKRGARVGPCSAAAPRSPTRYPASGRTGCHI